MGDTMMEALDKINYPDVPDVPEELVEDTVHDRVMKELQLEWFQGRNRYTDQRMVMYGIRSSQISALVMYLIKKGVLK